MKNSSFSYRLTQAISDAGLKAADLCRECSISKSTMSQYLSGKYEAKHDRIVQMANVLGCSADWLAGQDVPMTPSVSDGVTLGTVPVLRMFGLDFGSLFASENIIGYEACDGIYCDGHHFIMTACDKSMYPLILEGDSILCAAQNSLSHGQTGVYLLPDGKALIGRYSSENNEETIVFANGFFPPYAFAEIPGVRVVGRVVRTVRKWQ